MVLSWMTGNPDAVVALFLRIPEHELTNSPCQESQTYIQPVQISNHVTRTRPGKLTGAAMVAVSVSKTDVY